ncbi:MAG TPA: membrane protein insertase YidC [Polyangia bacterium]|jgi:YidC/Oxa1 family membrane protein insertase|nr:membrane protein insertase YidC [Polyangia bacterium]
MEKRVFITMVLSVAIIIGWNMRPRWLFPELRPPVQPSTAVVTPSAPVAPTVPASAGAPGERPEEQRITVVRPGFFRAVFTSWGAAPAEFTLLNPQYKEKVWVPKKGAGAVRQGEDDPNWESKLEPINLIKPQAGILPYSAYFPESSFQLPPSAAWTLTQQTEDELVYTVDVGSVHLEKHWRLPREGYELGLQLVVEHRGKPGEAPITANLAVPVSGWQDPAERASGLGFGRRYKLTQASCDIGGKLRHKTHEDLLHGRSGGFLSCNQGVAQPPGFSESGDVKWVGIGEPFFLVAAAFGPTEGSERRCRLSGDPSGQVLAEALFPTRRVEAGQKVTYEMAAYLGPKLLDRLDAVTVGGADVHLKDAVDYTLEFIARPMLWVLKQIQRVVWNWGVAVILITILLKLITYYPTVRSMKSMRAMTSLKPKMDALREKYGEDKNRLNQEVMNLYKQHGINPLGGCLPMLIQMPIYLAFYSMLSNAVEIYRASFVGPVNDLTAPYWPLAVITGGIMFIQAKLSPQSPDSQQQQMMMYMMPVMMALFTLFTPSGLTLYILINSLLTMAQQWWFNRTHPLTPSPASKPARA